MFDWLKHKVRDKFPSAEEKKNRELQRLLAIPNKSAEDCANLAWNYCERNQSQEGILWINHSLELNPHPSDARILSRAAFVYQDMGDFENAIKFHKQAITLLDPIKDKDRLLTSKYLLSDSYFNINDSLNSRENLDFVITNAEPVLFYLELYINIMIMMGQFSECLSFLLEQLTKHPGNQEILCVLGAFYYERLFDPATALTYFNQVASIEFRSPIRNQHLSYLYFFEQLMWSLLLTGEMEKAKDITNYAYSRRKIDREEYLSILMYYYSEINDIPAMDRIISQVNNLKSKKYSIICKVDVLLDNNRGDEVLEEIRSLYEQNPKDNNIVCAYVKLMIVKKEYDTALKSLSQSIQSKPKPVQAYFYYGVCHMALGEYQSALDTFTIISADYPNHREPRMGAAVCQKKLGHPEIAQRILLEIKGQPRNYEIHPDIIAAFNEEFPGEYLPDAYIM
jgi:tetratricopeptide (TPR) repeat protein